MKIVGREEGRGCYIHVFREHDSCQRGSKNKEFLDFYAHNYALMQVYRAVQTLYKPFTPNVVEPCTPASHDEWEHEFIVFIISWDGEKSRWRKIVVLSENILRGGLKKQRIHGFSCSHFIMSSRDLLFLRSTSSRCFKNHGGTKQVVTSYISLTKMAIFWIHDNQWTFLRCMLCISINNRKNTFSSSQCYNTISQ